MVVGFGSCPSKSLAACSATKRIAVTKAASRGIGMVSRSRFISKSAGPHGTMRSHVRPLGLVRLADGVRS